MIRIFLTMALMASIIFGGLVGCNSAKAMKTIRDGENKAAQTLIYINDITKAVNDARTAGDIGPAVHKPIIDAAQKALNGVNAFIGAVKTAKANVAAGSDASGQVDILKAFFNQNTAWAVTALISLVATVPPALHDKIGLWVTALQLALDAVTTLLAEIQMEVAPNAG